MNEKPEAKRQRRESFGPDGRSPLSYFDNATAHIWGDEITLSLFDTQRHPDDPDKTPVRYLRAQLDGAKALRSVLDDAIALLGSKLSTK